MTVFVLKLIAIITMFIDHAGSVLFPQHEFLRIIGRIAFPIFAFLIANGFIHTRNTKKYLIRLGVFAVLAQPIYNVVLYHQAFYQMPPHRFNILFNLFLGVVMLIAFRYLWEKKNIVTVNLEGAGGFKGFLYKQEHLVLKAIAIGVVILIGYICEKMPTGYGWYGILTIFLCYIFYNKKWALVFALLFINIGQNISVYMQNETFYIQFYCVLALPFLFFYNGKPGPKAKYLFYIFYPAHLALIGLIAYFM